VKSLSSFQLANCELPLVVLPVVFLLHSLVFPTFQNTIETFQMIPNHSNPKPVHPILSKMDIAPPSEPFLPEFLR
jgi:hypothetical protein